MRGPLDWSDRFRTHVWYRRIRQVFPEHQYSDHYLDRLFAGNDVRPSGDPIKIFSRIRRGAVPSLTADGPAGIDVVAAVERHVPGAAELLASEFWEIVKRPPGVAETIFRLEAFIESNGLQRLRVEEFDQRYGAVGIPSARVRRETSMKLALNVLNTDLKRLTFLALLAREADFAGQIDALELARSYFDEHLERFLWTCSDTFLIDEYLRILHRVLHAGRGISRRELDARGAAEVLSARVVACVEAATNAQTKVGR